MQKRRQLYEIRGGNFAKVEGKKNFSKYGGNQLKQETEKQGNRVGIRNLW